METTATSRTPANSASNPRRRWYARKRIVVPAAAVVLLWIVVGPWPLWEGRYEEAGYFERTMRQLEAAKVMRSYEARGEVEGDAGEAALMAGAGSVVLDVPEGHPLAGYSARKDKAMTDVDSACAVRAVTLSRGGVTVTIVGGDLLLVTEELAIATARRAGVRRDELYFTATHTHSGPGGYAHGMVQSLVFGKFDEAWFGELASALAEAVKRSRAAMRPAAIAAVSVDVPDLMRHRIEADVEGDSRAWVLLVRAVEKGGEIGRGPAPPEGGGTRTDKTVSDTPGSSHDEGAAVIAAVGVYAAHATVLGKHSRALSGDYPGAFARRFAARSGAEVVLFAAGAGAEAGPRVGDGAQATEPREQARAMGERLADRLFEASRDARFKRDVSLASLRVPIELPFARFRMGRHWRASPVVTRWLIDDVSSLHALRVGDVVMIGWPGDVEGALAKRLQAHGQSLGVRTMVTGFNGDYHGYLMSRATCAEHDVYETGLINLHGGEAGEMCVAVSEGMVGRVVGE